jgi:hypothetical protein
MRAFSASYPSGETPPYNAEKESNESRFCVVSFRMKTGRVAEAPCEEEEKGNFEDAL